jgi:hypothetical protein
MSSFAPRWTRLLHAGDAQGSSAWKNARVRAGGRSDIGEENSVRPRAIAVDLEPMRSPPNAHPAGNGTTPLADATRSGVGEYNAVSDYKSLLSLAKSSGIGSPGHCVLEQFRFSLPAPNDAGGGDPPHLEASAD